MNITEKLNQLANIQAQADCLKLDLQEKIQSVMPPEVKAAIDDLEAEYAQKLEAVQANITALEAEIKADVLAQGATAKGLFLQAVWNKGRVSWDTKALDGYAAAHPEINVFRKVGEPTVSFRKAPA